MCGSCAVRGPGQHSRGIRTHGLIDDDPEAWIIVVILQSGEEHGSVTERRACDRPHPERRWPQVERAMRRQRTSGMTAAENEGRPCVRKIDGERVVTALLNDHRQMIVDRLFSARQQPFTGGQPPYCQPAVLDLSSRWGSRTSDHVGEALNCGASQDLQLGDAQPLLDLKDQVITNEARRRRTYSTL